MLFKTFLDKTDFINYAHCQVSQHSSEAFQNVFESKNLVMPPHLYHEDKAIHVNKLGEQHSTMRTKTVSTDLTVQFHLEPRLSFHLNVHHIQKATRTAILNFNIIAFLLCTDKKEACP